MKYGIDEYSRYVEHDDGERLCVEPWPFLRRRYFLSDLRMIPLARIDVALWHIGMIRQHGWRTWLEYRKF